MTSRERVIAAINHREPDRVPVDFNPLLDFYLGLKAYLGVEIDETVKWNSAMEVIPHESLLSKIGIDLTSVKLASGRSGAKHARSDGLVEDGWGVLRKEVRQAKGSYMETVHRPLAEDGIDDLDRYPWPRCDAPGVGEDTEREAKRLFEDTDLAIVGRFGGPIMETCIELIGFERWFMGLAAEPEFIDSLMRHVTDVCIEFDRVGIEAAGRYVQIFKVSGEDFGAQNGPLYSMEMFEKQLLPHVGRRWKAARECLDAVNRDAKIMLHSCGSVRAYIPRFIASGIDILDPVQPLARDMDSAALKAEFGSRIVFHGGVDIQHVMSHGTRQEVLDETRKRIRDYGPGGGYILTTSHNVQADVPPENFMTMLEAVREWGSYPV
ncbi:MAG TPA: uroporphyrinogen decarboxylase family protein [Spirochaetia bacterium]